MMPNSQKYKPGAALFIAFALFLAPSVIAQDAPSEALTLTKEQQAQLQKDGEKLASNKCASCHSIKKRGDSPNKDAPPFRTFASKWPLESLEESLAEGIVTGHAEMPETVFTPDEIAAFLEFLSGIQTDPKAAPAP